MSIMARFGFRKKPDMKVDRARQQPPVYTEVRSQSMNSLYSYEDFLIDIIRHHTIKKGVYHPHLPTLIVKYVPIYSWSEPWSGSDDSEQRDEKDEDIMKVELSHCNTIASNRFLKFGAVLGSKLDPRLDHVINVQLVDGVEFGVGICDESQLKKNTRRDFMCLDGGYGYYNYKAKKAGMKPKYPPGLYYLVQTCRKIRNDAEIFQAGDVLTMVIQRENVKFPGGGINLRSSFGSERDRIFDPMHNLEASSRYTLSFYKNGEDMGFHLGNLEGPFYMCLNYYFVACKIRLLSDYNFRKKYKQWTGKYQSRQQIPRMTNKTSESSGSYHPRSASSYRFNPTGRSRTTYM